MSAAENSAAGSKEPRPAQYFRADAVKRTACTLPMLWIQPFAAPTKFIGPIDDRAQADRLAEQNGWVMAADGPHWRRVVPSPEPLRLVEQESNRAARERRDDRGLRRRGGAPVVDNGQLHGVEAVVDKDLTSASSRSR